MKYRVVLTPKADRQVAEIADWLAARSPVGAAAWLAALRAALDRLEFNPLGFALATESIYIPIEIREFSFKTRRGRTYRGVFRVIRSNCVRAPYPRPRSESAATGGLRRVSGMRTRDVPPGWRHPFAPHYA